jgi:hypothetical protein
MQKFIPARKIALLALAAHPDWSNARLARAAGIGTTTVFRLRPPGGPGAPATRLGRDGRQHPATRKRR